MQADEITPGMISVLTGPAVQKHFPQNVPENARQHTEQQYALLKADRDSLGGPSCMWYLVTVCIPHWSAITSFAFVNFILTHKYCFCCN